MKVINRRKPQAVKPQAASGPKRNAAQIIAALRIAPTQEPVLPGVSIPTQPYIAPQAGTFAHAAATAGPRKWFQLATTPELSGYFDILMATLRCGSANELAARVFDEVFIKYGIKK